MNYLSCLTSINLFYIYFISNFAILFQPPYPTDWTSVSRIFLHSTSFTILLVCSVCTYAQITLLAF